MDGAVQPGLRGLIPGREELRATVALAVPVVAVQVGLMLMGVVDTIMVGRVSAADLAAVALGNLYFFVPTVFGMGILMALDPVVSQAIGARDDEAVARGVQRGNLMALGLGLGCSLVLLTAGPVFTLLRQPPDVIPVATGYTWATIPGVFPFLAFIVLRQTLQAMGRVAPIVWTILWANLANLFFNWVFIFGHLGVDPMGAVGSGWASSLCRWLLWLGLLVAVRRPLAPFLRPLRPEALRLAPIGRMLRLGSPIGIQFTLEFGAFAVIALFMGWLGTLAMAGHQVAINLASLTFMVPLGVSQAAAVVVGRAVGAEDPRGARRAAGAGIALGGGFMVATMALFIAVPGLLAAVYTDEVPVRALAAALIPIAGVFQVFDGIQAVASGVLRGVGDTRAPMVVNLLGFWLVGIPVSLGLGFGLDVGPVGLWWGLVAGLAAVSFFLLLRVRVRFGRELRRLVIDEAESAPEVVPAPGPAPVSGSSPAS